MPHVAAIAADRDGIVYEGAAGPRVAGERRPGERRHALPDHVDDQDGRHGGRAAADGARRSSTSTRRSSSTAPSAADLQVLDGLRRRHAAAAAPGDAGDGQAARHPHLGRSYWFWNADIVHWEAVTETPNVLSGSKVIFTRAAGRRPGDQRSSTASTPTGWARWSRRRAGRRSTSSIEENITGPLGMTETAFLMTTEQRRELGPGAPARARTAPGRRATSSCARTPEYWAGGHGLHSTPRDYMKFQRALLRRRTSSTACGSCEQDTVDAAFTNQIGDLDFPAEIPTADPASTMRLQRGAGLQVGLRAAAQHRGRPGHAARVERRVGRAAQHPLLGRPHDRRDCGAIYTQFLPVRHAGGDADVPGLRAGAVRVALTGNVQDRG